MGLSKPGF